MTHLSKDPTDHIPASSSAEKTGDQGQLSKPSRSLGKMPTFTQTMSPQLLATLPGAPKNWQEWDQINTASWLLRSSLMRLQKHGLVTLMPVLSADGQTILSIQVCFNMDKWDEQLILKVLSEADNTDNTKSEDPTTQTGSNSQ